MKKSVMTLLASCLMVSSVMGFNYDANIGYFPVARQSGGIYQVDGRVFYRVPYGQVFGGVGILGSNRNNSFDLWVAGATGFQFDSIEAIQAVSVKPEVSIVVNGYTNANAALALGAVVSVPHQTAGLTGGFIRWSLNGDVLVGLNFSQPFGGSSSCRMADCKKGASKECHGSEWSCRKSTEAPVSQTKAYESVAPSSVATDPVASNESGAARIALAVKTDTVSFQDIKGRKGEGAIIALTRVGLFSDSTRFFPNRKPTVAEYNAVMTRLIKALGLPEVAAAKEVPNKAQVVAEIRNVLMAATQSYPDAKSIEAGLTPSSATKKKDAALSREGLAVLVYDQLRVVPGLLGGN